VDLWNLAKKNARFVALEQPMSVLGKAIGKRSQEIHPWQFGHKEQKTTWLWLVGFKNLKPTKNVYRQMMKLPKNKRERIAYMAKTETRGRDRALTFKGIAAAMADQWTADFLKGGAS
jgi:hypothetical protein